MELLILELISMLDSKKYSDILLINSLLIKLSEINDFNDSYINHSFASLSDRSKSAIKSALRQKIDLLYENKELNKALRLEEDLISYCENQCLKFSYCSKCYISKRVDLVKNVIQKHERIKTQIFNDISIEFLNTKAVIIKLNHLLTSNKFKNYETSKQ